MEVVRRLARGGEGSVTLESALVMPMILLVTISFLFAALYAFEQARLKHAVSSAVMRAASAWTCCVGGEEAGRANSTGNVLYGRWRETLSFNGLPGTESDSGSREVPVPAGGFVPQTPVQSKLLQAAVGVPAGASGRLRFQPGLVLSKVEGAFTERFRLPSSLLKPAREAAAAARSGVVEPAEWIRVVELVRHYAGELVEKHLDREAAARKVREYLELHAPGTFARHSEAASYLRLLVNGREHMVELSESRRLIDALTDHGVAHQAYLTFTEKQLREQMAKDVELLRQGGIVSGVVWHFFRRTGQTGRVGPSDRLLEELRANGIVVVIHD